MITLSRGGTAGSYARRHEKLVNDAGQRSNQCGCERSARRSKRPGPSAGGARVIGDTNVPRSGLFWRGTPHVLIEHVRAGALTLITSPATNDAAPMRLARPGALEPH